MSITAPRKQRRAIQTGRKRPTEPAEAIAGELCAEKYRLLLRVAKKNSINRDDAEEALQEAFTRFISRFDPNGPAPALPWLLLTLKRECWAKSRAEHLDRRVDWEGCGVPDHLDSPLDLLPSERPTPQEMAERSEELTIARARFMSLKPAERRTIGLIELGYSYAEVGEITGFSKTKINRCASEGRARLRELRAEGDDPSPVRASRVAKSTSRGNR